MSKVLNNTTGAPHQSALLQYDPGTNTWAPYETVQAANEAIAEGQRYIGLQVMVADQLHHYAGGTADEDLVPVGGAPVAPANTWDRQGNAGTNPATDFAGTRDDVDFALARGGDKAILIKDGRVVLNSVINNGWFNVPAPQNAWYGIAYGNGLFVAVAASGTHRVMTSLDGINWSLRLMNDQNSWRGITYGNGLFVAVAASGTHRVMTSADGVNWNQYPAPEQNQWSRVAFGNGLFVAVARNGTNRVMTSMDGINWILRSVPTNIMWEDVCFGNNQFVAVGGLQVGQPNTYNRIMKSDDGVTWSPVAAPNYYYITGITFGNNLFVAVTDASINNIIVSNDAVNWQVVNPPQNSQWKAVTFGNGQFVTVASNVHSGQNSNYRLATSFDGINWSIQEVQPIAYRSITFGNNLFVGVAENALYCIVSKIEKLYKLAVGTDSPHASAIAEFSSTEKGLLIPRLTTEQINLIPNPANSLMVFDTTIGRPKIFITGVGWEVWHPRPVQLNNAQRLALTGMVNGTEVYDTDWQCTFVWQASSNTWQQQFVPNFTRVQMVNLPNPQQGYRVNVDGNQHTWDGFNFVILRFLNWTHSGADIVITANTILIIQSFNNLPEGNYLVLSSITGYNTSGSSLNELLIYGNNVLRSRKYYQSSNTGVRDFTLTDSIIITIPSNTAIDIRFQSSVPSFIRATSSVQLIKIS